MKKNTIQTISIVSLIYFVINLVAHFTYTPLRTLFMDDISLFNQLNGISFIKYIAVGHDNKFRPISDLFIYIGYFLFKNNTDYIYIYILIIGAISCVIVFIIVYYITEKKNLYIPSIVCLLFSISRFAYYTVGQYFGVMESVCIIFASLLLYTGYKYYITADNSHEKNIFVWLNISLLLLVFSHERYITMYAFACAVVFLKEKFSKTAIKRYTYIIINFFLLWIFRFIYLGSGAFQGTGGTSLISTLNISNILKFLKEGLLLVFGWNAGEEYLNGITMSQVKPIHNIIPVFTLIITLLIFFYAVKKADDKKRIIEINLLFIAFILFSLLSGCITIRLELRWVYIPFVIYLILVTFNVNEILKKELLSGICKNVLVVVCFFTLAVLVFNESYYREYWSNNYLGQDYNKYNNIYDMTVRKYGPDKLKGKSLYIVENKEYSEVIDHNTLKGIFDYYVGYNLVDLNYVETINEIDDEDEAIVLYAEQYKDNIWEKKFYNITNLLDDNSKKAEE